MLIPLVLLPMYLLGDERLVNQLLWDNKLGVPVCSGIVNANVSITALVPTEGQICLKILRTRWHIIVT